MTTEKPLPHNHFTRQLWDSAADIIHDIYNHPFCMGLARGDLPIQSFKNYLGQDALYIIEDSRALAYTAARAEDPEEMHFFLAMAKDGLDIERAMQSDFFEHFNIVRPTSPSIACRNYTNFLLNKARDDDYPVAVAALLPCFWVYRETSLNILKHSKPDNPYQKWLNTYADEDFSGYVERFIEITGKLMESAPEGVRQRMTDAFRESTRLEYEFFEESLPTTLSK